jgi:hypothetical protein
MTVFPSTFGKQATGVGKYWFGMGSYPERYTDGPFDTEEEAVAEAINRMEEDDRDSATVGVGEEVCLTVPDADDVIERLSLSAYDECGELSDDFLDKVPKDAKEELTAAIDKAVGEWLTKHDLWPQFFKVGEARELTALDRHAVFPPAWAEEQQP